MYVYMYVFISLRNISKEGEEDTKIDRQAESSQLLVHSLKVSNRSGWARLGQAKVGSWELSTSLVGSESKART